MEITENVIKYILLVLVTYVNGFLKFNQIRALFKAGDC